MRSLPAEAIKAFGRDATGRLDNPFVREEVIRAEIDGRALLATIERYKAEAKAGQGVGAKSAILKYAGTELNKRRYEAFMTIGGSDALEWESARSDEGTLAREWLRTKANSIEGGTSEIMLGIVAKRILNLPEA
jgi:alkylation response protein AidB-like acyl-CoA dehydrogenase